MGKRPAYLHYAKDWLTDTNLSLCSKAAKGVWQDVLDVMFLNSVCGVACYAGGAPWTDEELARAIGGDISENVSWIRELLDKGVAHRNTRGAIYSRRMVADEQERQSNITRQQKHRNGNNTENVTPFVTRTSGDGTGEAFEVDVGSKTKECDAQEIYKCYPRKIGRRAGIKAITGAFLRLLAGKESPNDLFQSDDDVKVYLIQRTRLFATSPAGNNGEYTPHPATWFNRSSYLDDESEWSKNGNGNGHEQPSPQIARVKRSYEAIHGAFADDGGGDGDPVQREVRQGTDSPGGKVMEGNSRAATIGSD